MKIGIETKFNIGDRVYFMDDNRAVSDIIGKINVKSETIIDTSSMVIKPKTSNKVIYKVERQEAEFVDYNDYRHPRIFATKEELLKSL